MRGIHHHISYLILNYEIEFFVRLYLRTSPQPPFKCIGLAVGSLGYKYNKGEHLKGGWGKFSPGIPPPTRYKKFYFVIQGYLKINARAISISCGLVSLKKTSDAGTKA